ncbi:MAG: hypothetical protein IT462_10370 [Planctomycetes bacterium]|nr:hypothetical protein [Planctomycetota bacterium]
MDRKTLHIAGLAAGACLLVMLAIVIGLVAYNTFVNNAQVVSAQAINSGTDKGPSWTVTPITAGDVNKQYIVVVAESDRDFVGMSQKKSNPKTKVADRNRVKNMAIYRLKPENSEMGIEFVGARTIEYDLMVPSLTKVDNHDKWKAYDVWDYVGKLEDRVVVPPKKDDKSTDK